MHSVIVKWREFWFYCFHEACFIIFCQHFFWLLYYLFNLIFKLFLSRIINLQFLKNPIRLFFEHFLFLWHFFPWALPPYGQGTLSPFEPTPGPEVLGHARLAELWTIWKNHLIVNFSYRHFMSNCILCIFSSQKWVNTDFKSLIQNLCD